MDRPKIAGWNLALRFGLELAALAGLAAGAWSGIDGTIKWAAVAGAPVAGAAIWGVFNVPNDPSRSGGAPIVVPGLTRLGIGLLIFGGGAFGIVVAGQWEVALGFLAMVVLHYVLAWDRVRWLLQA